MKKTLLICGLVGLTACATTTGSGNGLKKE